MVCCSFEGGGVVMMMSVNERRTTWSSRWVGRQTSQCPPSSASQDTRSAKGTSCLGRAFICWKAEELQSLQQRLASVHHLR